MKHYGSTYTRSVVKEQSPRSSISRHMNYIDVALAVAVVAVVTVAGVFGVFAVCLCLL